MKPIKQLSIALFFYLLIINDDQSLVAQPISVYPSIQINLYLNVSQPSSCIAVDPITKSIYYGNVTGNVYKVIESTTNYDTLLFDSLDHGIPYLQGMAFKDSSLFVVGNDWTNGTQGIGILKKGKLQPNGTRVWTTVMQTVLYPATNATFDHGFSGIAIDPTGNYIFISSGSRSDHGEIQTAGGTFPTTREVPLTSAIFKIPINTLNLTLPNNDSLLKAGGWLFADGTRNSFGLAFNGRGDLLGVENSGDRDDSEEMNFIQAGKHYGFPWKMGTNLTPQQFPGYNPATDPLVNPNSKASQMGYFYNDSTYPPSPTSVVFTDPIENFGPDANYYRDTIDGKIYKANSQSLGTFTMHRCPVGLVFDKDSLLTGQFKGDGFMLSFTQGKGDSSGYLASSIWGLPVVPIDTSEDLVHLEMLYDQATNSYSVNATRIVYGFNLPVGAAMLDTVIYALEYGSTGNRHIWKISMPGAASLSLPDDSSKDPELQIFPNPVKSILTLGNSKLIIEKIEVIDMTGRMINVTVQKNNSIDVFHLQSGNYILKIITKEKIFMKKFVKINN